MTKDELKDRLAELETKAKTISVEPWFETIKDWVGNVTSGVQWEIPSMWYVEDIRHLHNIHNGYGLECAQVADDSPLDRWDIVHDFADYVGDFMEDLLGYCYWD